MSADKGLNTGISATTIGRLVKDYQLYKADVSEEGKIILNGFLKVQSKKYDTTSDKLALDLDIASIKAVTEGVTAKRESYQKRFITFCIAKLLPLCNSNAEVTKGLKELVTEGKSLAENNRIDKRRMIFLSVDENGIIYLYFGGWKDSESKLRTQYAIGRFNPDSTTNLDLEAIQKLLVNGTKPYLTGMSVPDNSKSGYDLTDKVIGSQDVTKQTDSQLLIDGTIVDCDLCHKKHAIGSKKYKEHKAKLTKQIIANADATLAKAEAELKAK